MRGVVTGRNVNFENSTKVKEFCAKRVNEVETQFSEAYATERYPPDTFEGYQPPDTPLPSDGSRSLD